MSEKEVIELFEELVPEYKLSKEKTNGAYLKERQRVLNEEIVSQESQ